MENKSPWYMSSEDPYELSLTIKGALMMYVPFILAVAASLHVPLTNNMLVEIITDTSFIISAMMLMWGSYRKIRNWFK